MADTSALLTDLRAEGEILDGLVADLPMTAWSTLTPAEGWTIAHQISHLAWTDRVALIAMTDPEGFSVLISEALADAAAYVESGAAEGVGEDPGALLARWRTGREGVLRALAQVPDGTRVPWFGPPMSAASMATGRLMETWAHGQDVADALGVERQQTPRLRHIAHIGVRARDFSFRSHRLDPPPGQFRVELTGPDGSDWTWGPEDAPERVTGPALDFCLLVTQRRHRADLAVRAVGPDADRWLDIAQAFAGPPGKGREPR